MSLPGVGTVVNYYYSSGSTVPAIVQYVDDIKNLVMVTYINPVPSGSLSFPGASVLTSPWSSQGTSMGQWS